MGLQACQGSLCQCSFGAAPTPLNVLPVCRVLLDNKPAATIKDHVPFLNINPFGTCCSPKHPMMQALGVPGPCIPATSNPWIPSAGNALIQNIPALTQEHTLMCQLGGTITIADAGQKIVIAS